MSGTILEQIKAKLADPYIVGAVILAVVGTALCLGVVLGWLPFG
jgi:hypothetical protein